MLSAPALHPEKLSPETKKPNFGIFPPKKKYARISFLILPEMKLPKRLQ
jgi:hypothetical protein